MTFLSKILISKNSQQCALEELKNSNKSVVIYGAGTYAFVLKQYLSALGIKISKFMVDARYKVNNQFMETEVVSIEQFNITEKNIKVVIGIANYELALTTLAQNRITDALVIDVPDFLNIPHQFFDLNFIESHQHLFQNAYDLLEDDLSKETYLAAINTKINNDLTYIKPYVRLDHLYFTKTEFPVTNHEALLDVGGYNGDSIRDFHRITNGKYKSITSLEPCKKMYTDLLKTIDELSISDKCHPIQIGAWNKKTTLSFEKTTMEIDSKISENGENRIEVDTIDAIRNKLHFPITLVKMDINGSEFNALQGAKHTIQSDNPKIVIKLHTKEDFYRIPIFLKTIMPNMKIYIRQRNFMSMMLVLYGIIS